MLLLTEEGADGVDASSGSRAVTADLVFVTLMEQPTVDASAPAAIGGSAQMTTMGDSSRQQSTTIDRRPMMGHQESQEVAVSRPELRDPFSDLKAAFEPPKERLKTFNLKQIVTRNGTVLMNMLERLLETTEIDAHDVETEQTLLEYACQTGNIGLAKLCYRR